MVVHPAGVLRQPEAVARQHRPHQLSPDRGHDHRRRCTQALWHGWPGFRLPAGQRYLAVRNHAPRRSRALCIRRVEPDAPTLKWRKGCPNQDNDTGCDTGFEGIGQTWSAPKVVKASGYSSGPLLVFGGGYDKCEDVDTNDPAKACSSSTKGNKVYVLDANQGTVLKTFTTNRAVSGEVTIVTDATGLAKYAYAADLGGNVYRIDIKDAAPGAWTMMTLASLGCDDAVGCTPNRKFMFGPDVVEDNGVYVLLLGSGDREKPLQYYSNALSVANRFYMLVDKPSDDTC